MIERMPRCAAVIVPMLCAVCLVSCSPKSAPSELQGSHYDPADVKLPSTTPFDDDAAMRAVYQNYYWFGYAEALSGIGSTFCGNGHPWYAVQMRGFYDGQVDGFAHKHPSASSTRPAAAAPKVADHQPPAELVESLPGIAAVRHLGDGAVELSLSDADAKEGWELIVNGKGGAHNVAMPIEWIARHNFGYVGAGWHGFQYVGDRGPYLLIYEVTTFYDIVPDEKRLVQVLPYGASN
jgi:hypothetical protein